MTNWRGVTLDTRSAAMMDEVARLCPGVPITPTQGSWSGADASAGTHSGAGAIDIAAANLPQAQRDQIVLAMRRVGWAAWHRTPDQSDWPHHIHGVSMGEPGLSPQAYDQTRDYIEGRNGLASNAPDDGPRDFHYVGITWEEYLSGSGGGWLIEGVIDMSAVTVTFFHKGGTVYEADLIAGTYRGVQNPADLQDRKNVLNECGIRWTTWRDGAEVGNPEAFGVRI
jgi:hypothetical protein